jgi:hypothetical protein
VEQSTSNPDGVLFAVQLFKVPRPFGIPGVGLSRNHRIIEEYETRSVCDDRPFAVHEQPVAPCPFGVLLYEVLDHNLAPVDVERPIINESLSFGGWEYSRMLAPASNSVTRSVTDLGLSHPYPLSKRLAFNVFLVPSWFSLHATLCLYLSQFALREPHSP